jgi:capsular exopolysaccharide synthesis family protein
LTGISEQETTFELREYLGILRAHKLPIVITTLAAFGAAMLFSWLQTPKYHAEVRVLVRPMTTSATASAFPVPLNLETERQVASSIPVANKVVKDLALDQSATDLLETLDVTPVADSEVLVIGFTAPSAKAAGEVANSFALSFINYRQSQALDTLISAQEDIKKRITAAGSRLSGLTGQISKANGKGDEELATTLDSERTALIVQMGGLQDRYDGLQSETSITVAAGEVIEPAVAPSSPSSPDYKKNGGIALFLGLGLGILIAFVRERLDDRFRGGADVEQSMGVPVLATVPKFKVEIARRRRDGVLSLIVAQQPQGMAAEAFRTLRTNLQFAASQRDAKSFVMSSASAREGKSSTTANLGMVLAKAGKRVVLISADMRKPTLENYFGITSKTGLSMWLSGTVEDPWEVAQDAGVPNIKIVACGPVPGNPAELLTSPRFSELIETLERGSDVVLIDSPPVLPVADASIMASRVGGAILIIHSGVTPRSAAMRAREELERAGAPIVGTVLNAFDPSNSAYYYRPYYYGDYVYGQNGSGDSNGNGRSLEKSVAPKIRSLFGSGR